MESPLREVPPLKRLRGLEDWEASIYSENIASSERKSLGISDIFSSCAGTEGPGNQHFGGGNGGFFTLRMEHREGGVGSGAHKGEERLLFFRSDRPGCIGKIIYSSQPAKSALCGLGHTRSVWKDKALAGADWCQKNCDFNTDEMNHLAQAKIHVLDVKREYRGRDLGGLLFFEAISSLRNRYDSESESENEAEDDGTFENTEFSLADHPSVLCQLDAEEDTRRHNKLLHFYEDLGCHVKPHAKIRYLNNNDGEMYRSIPMQIPIRGFSGKRSRQAASLRRKAGKRGNVSLIGRSFLPILLLEADGRKVRVSTRTTANGRNVYGRERRLDWIITEEGDCVAFRTSQGKHLCAEPSGRVVVDRPVFDSWESFRVRRVPDADDSDSEGEQADSSARTKRRLFTFQTCHGSFLTIDPETHALSCSHYPIIWVASGERFSLTCTLDTPLRRRHYCTSWTHGVSFINAMREKYLRFESSSMSIRKALNLVHSLPCHRFHVKGSEPSLRSYLFYIAEDLRWKGYPDWVQLIALVHGLARVLNVLKISSADGPDGYDWTLTTRARVVGCAPPARVVFSEYRGLDPDSNNDTFKTQLGRYEAQCGMEKLLLTWTGPEYMYFLLKENGVTIPPDGFAMLRLFPLSDWHTYGEYGHLMAASDEEVKPFVAEFDQAIRRAKRSCGHLSDDDCERLLDEHYDLILGKYNCDGELRW